LSSDGRIPGAVESMRMAQKCRRPNQATHRYHYRMINTLRTSNKLLRAIIASALLPLGVSSCNIHTPHMTVKQAEEAPRRCDA
jgi:hypothetical protein